MANLTNNRIQASITEEAEQKFKQGVALINEALPFLVGLTAAERVNLPKINVSNKVFTEDAINVAANNSALFPAFLNIEEMRQDLKLYQKLDDLGGIISQILEKISDTQMLAGSEAYASALTVYKILGAASAAGVEGTKTAYDQLKERFAQTTSTPTKAE